ncbi:MAG TPA: AraC family transcriptional regulator [Roseiflexaceae bacterium]|nr:AraC family transcriptional regulator [Roseiflexaceae bacterium]
MTSPPSHDWSLLHRDPDLALDALEARFTRHAFVRHWHSYYVVGLIEAGAQSFRCQHATYQTPAGGLILLNPGEAHTGEAAASGGFAYRALYPTVEHMRQAMGELGRPDRLPLFRSVRADDPRLAALTRRVHAGLDGAEPPLAREAHWLALLTALIRHCGAEDAFLPAAGDEPAAVARARDYLEAHYAELVRLADLAAQVHLSPFHLIRVFQRAAGMPPHAYLESVRIRHAQALLAAGLPPAEVAYATGWSSQSHFTSRFRRIIGVTPGRYRRAL